MANRPLNIVFAGTPLFAVPTLERLIQSDHQLIGVYTQPDRPAGRGRALTESPVKQLALTYLLPIYQPVSLRDKKEQDRLADLKPDVMIVVAYGLLLPQAILNIPRLGCINVHASLLPRWRGAAPIQRALLAGDLETGITIMKMDAGLDTGPWLYKIAHPIIEKDTSASLHDSLSHLGAEALMQSLTALLENKLIPIPQENALSTHAPKIHKQEAEMNWHFSAADLERCVRAFQPWPVAQTAAAQHVLRIWDACVIPDNTILKSPPGTIVQISSTGIDVATGHHLLRLLTIQIPGSRVMSVADFLNSKRHWLTEGLRLGH